MPATMMPAMSIACQSLNSSLAWTVTPRNAPKVGRLQPPKMNDPRSNATGVPTLRDQRERGRCDRTGGVASGEVRVLGITLDSLVSTGAVKPNEELPRDLPAPRRRS